MNRNRKRNIVVAVSCLLLVLCAVFAAKLIFFEFPLKPETYTFEIAETEKRQAPGSPVWFEYRENNGLILHYTSEIQPEDIRLYGLTAQGAVELSTAEMAADGKIGEENLGSFMAVLPAVQSGDGSGQIFYIAKTDSYITQTYKYDPIPRYLNSSSLPLEIVFHWRRFISLYDHNELVKEGTVTVVSGRSGRREYAINQEGNIEGLSVPDIRSGITIIYTSHDGETYVTDYLVETGALFGSYYLMALIPLIQVTALTAAGIVLCQLIRKRRLKKVLPAEHWTGERLRTRTGAVVNDKTSSRFMAIRWGCMILMFLFCLFGGKLLGKQQALNHVGNPIFSCPFNQDQILESSCYYLSHAINIRLRGWHYIIPFFLSTAAFIIIFGRFLCGFLCPFGLIQDVMDRIRRRLGIELVILNERMMKGVNIVKWVVLILYVGLVFTGLEYCEICPGKALSPAMGGFKTTLYAGGYILVVVLVGSFFIRRFFCLVCPLGYIVGLLHNVSFFRLKKDCTACTECGGCYKACPMKIKSIYTEREKTDITTADCIMCGECIHKCPENQALSLTFAGKTIYRSSRKVYMSRYQPGDEAAGGGTRQEPGKELQAKGKQGKEAPENEHT